METLAENRDYQAVIRRFPGGSVEVAVTATKHMQRMAQSRRWQNFYPVRVVPYEMTEHEKEDKAKENKARSVRRARQSVRFLCKRIQADHMVTLSYRENMQDVARLKADWRALSKLYIARYPHWKYVCVREYQDRGSLHLHIACHGRVDLNYLRRCWYTVLGSAPDAQGAATPGAVNVTGPSKRWGGAGYAWKADKLAGYLTKYLHKCFDVAEASSKRYWASKGVEPPEVLKVWMGATNHLEALRESYALTKQHVSQQIETWWASEGWGAIWLSG